MDANRRRFTRTAATGLVGVATLLGLLFGFGCDRPAPPRPKPGTQTTKPTTRPSRARGIQDLLTPALRAVATRPAPRVTGLFLDRRSPDDLRVLSYNVYRDSIFPRPGNLQGAAKFQRILKALDPDIVCMQEIRNYTAAEVADLLDRLAPLPDGGHWHTFKAAMQVIASKYPLRLTAEHTVPAAGTADGRRLRDPAMALVDLPDERFSRDVYVLNNHFKCCGGEDNDPLRQRQADAIVNWLRDARTPGGHVDLPPKTGIIVVGDLNLVGGPRPLQTLLSGDIANEDVYGPDAPPDWDETELTDAHPLHNGQGPDDYTWRNDDDQWPPGRLDYVIYSDSVLQAVHRFVLNTTAMTDEELKRAGLERYDVTLDEAGRRFDHLPLVVDFRLVGN